MAQAEAVIDIINSKTEKEMQASVSQLKGRISTKINEIQSILLDTMADIEASIDYPEYDVEETTNEKIITMLNKVKTKLKALEDSYKQGKIIKNGIKTALIGKPNVGKSSLLNLLLNEERAIVSDIEGTTRDTIEEYINLKGIPLKIIDTAGIRETSDEIEQIGVKKTIDNIEHADLIIAIFDDSREFEEEDKKILNLIEERNAIILLNKTDLQLNKINIENLQNKKIIKFSTKEETGLDELYNAISELFEIEAIRVDNGEVISNIRQKEHITNSTELVKKALEVVETGVPSDIIAIYLKEILI